MLEWAHDARSTDNTSHINSSTWHIKSLPCQFFPYYQRPGSNSILSCQTDTSIRAKASDSQTIQRSDTRSLEVQPKYCSSSSITKKQKNKTHILRIYFDKFVGPAIKTLGLPDLPYHLEVRITSRADPIHLKPNETRSLSDTSYRGT